MNHRGWLQRSISAIGCTGVILGFLVLSGIRRINAAEGDPVAENGPANDDADQEPQFELTEDVRQALLPLFRRIAESNVTRVTVEMLNDSLVNGSVVDSSRGLFQIASRKPNDFTIYLKETDRRTRLYSDGNQMIVALAPDSYVKLPEPMELQDVVTSVPVIMGPYPEPILALSMAGVDPAISWVGGMEVIEVADRANFADGRPAIHLVGRQADGVAWDLWISNDDSPEPLRMLFDLTPMLIQSQKMPIPAGYSQQIRYDFKSFRTSGDLQDSLFRYTIKPSATQYDSVDQYYNEQQLSGEKHPLVGETAPNFRAADLNGKVIDSRQLKGRILVIDFWASWCKPCLEAMPMIEAVTKQMRDKNVVMLSINTGEQKQAVQKFYRDEKITIPTLLDPEGKIADGFKADRIPQTTIVDSNGIVTDVLTGFNNSDDAAERLKAAIERALEPKR